jgi:hypothetical protein
MFYCIFQTGESKQEVDNDDKTSALVKQVK